MTIAELFFEIKHTSGTNDKLALVKANQSTLLDDLFRFAYDSDLKYHTKQLNETVLGQGHRTIEDVWSGFMELLVKCNSGYLSGNDAKLELERMLNSCFPDDAKILYNVLQRNLKIGVSMENYRKAIGATDRVFETALANKIQDAKKVNVLDGSYLGSRKLDGCRCTCWVKLNRNERGVLLADTPRLVSRQGKEFKTLNKLKPYMQFFAERIGNEGSYVFDGEVSLVDGNGDEHFDWIMKEINRKDHTIEHPRYNIFDILTEEEFYMEKESRKFSERYKLLCDMFDKCTDIQLEDADLKEYAAEDFDQYLTIVYQERICSQDDFARWQKKVEDGHWEGFMLRKDVPYQSGRSNDLLKVKKMQDAEYKVIGTINGKVTYNEGGQKEFDACSALVIEHRGNQVKVGSGLSKEQRLRWFDHPEEIVGKTITVQYFEETTDKKAGTYSLRFPILKYVYENGRDC